jgi:cell division septum initiation protein DivIVA
MSTATLEHPTMPFPPEFNIEQPDHDLAATTVNLKLRFGLLGNSRKVNTSQVQVDADKDQIRVSKHLLESKELDAIRQADGAIRRELDLYCLPGFDIGLRLLPWGALEAVTKRLKQYASDRERLVDAFIDAYPQLCREAAASLRSLYNAKDYPPAEYVRTKFHFSYQYLSFGTPEGLEDVNREIFAEEREKAEAVLRDATTEARDFMRATVSEMVTHLRDRLTPDADGKPKRLHATAVTNLQQFLDTFSLRNVSNDRELAAEIEKLRGLLSGADVDEIRKDDDWRATVRTKLAEVETSLSGLVETRPGRKFRFAVE